jgi:hypothetical protein
MMELQLSSFIVAEEVFDLEDLKFRTNELTDFVNDTSTVYGVSTFQFKNIQKPFDIELLVNVL